MSHYPKPFKSITYSDQTKCHSIHQVRDTDQFNVKLMSKLVKMLEFMNL